MQPRPLIETKPARRRLIRLASQMVPVNLLRLIVQGKTFQRPLRDGFHRRVVIRILQRYQQRLAHAVVRNLVIAHRGNHPIPDLGIGIVDPFGENPLGILIATRQFEQHLQAVQPQFQNAAADKRINRLNDLYARPAPV